MCRYLSPPTGGTVASGARRDRESQITRSSTNQSDARHATGEGNKVDFLM